MQRLAQETVGRDEPQIIQSIMDDMLAVQRAKYKPGTVARRDVHSKSHGTVKAEFRVLPDIPAACRVGLFSRPATYQALVRLSNGAPGTGADAFPNVRGLAIKLMGVPGAKILPGDETSSEHDFLLANHHTFFVRYLKDYGPLNRLVNSGALMAMFKQYPVETLMVMRAILKLIKNPLQIAYFSQLPYLFGEDQSVKYALYPSTTAPLLSFPNLFDADYLLHAVQHLLSKRQVNYTFCVQFQQDPEREPIEDSSVAWTGAWVPVAELAIPMIDKPVLESDGESLSFNPWRVLKEHRPLGWPSRVRQPVYAADRQWRKETNDRR